MNAQQKKYADWRIPTVKELALWARHINEYDLDDYYWSSSNYFFDKGFAWVVRLGDGNDTIDFKTTKNYVRCVRDGDDGLEWSITAPKKLNWRQALGYARTLKCTTSKINKK